MTREESIFADALGRRSGAERDAYLDEACAGDVNLRRAVAALLLAHERAAGILESPPAGLDVTSDVSPSVHGVGSTIGPYKLLEQIGGGGMGVVFMAEQVRPVRRKVALKVIKPGMDSGQVIARFEAERQALTMMDHPNIARVLDAGTTDAGRPYFVMELVKGVPITDFCDQARLDPRQRLDLFVQVCNAVQHAHQKGIIHRDLKPGNVLVTLHDDKPVPKVIDFGIAKATGQQLTERTLFTNYAQMLGTPLYMSPEQAQLSGLDVDTRSDVYSLGVLLYELLTGTTPFEKQRLREAAYDEMRRIIREEDPPKPSTRLSSMADRIASISALRHTEPKKLSQLVHGELDWIVMKSLEKDRARRYETAIGLGRDVERYLRDEAVQAVPPSVGYRLWKFVRRNRGLAVATGAAAVTLLAVVATLAASNVAIGRAYDQRTKALGEVRDRQAKLTAALTREQETTILSQRVAEQRRVDLYPPRIKLAWQHWSDGDLIRMREVLDSLHPETGQTDLRGFEWRYLWRLAHATRQTFHHPHPVRSVAVSPDGKLFAAAGPGSKEVWLWHAAGALKARLDAGNPVLAVAFAPDGSEVAAGGEDGTVRTWDVAAGQVRRTFSGSDGPVGNLAYSPDGTRLATAVGWWTFKSGNPVTRFLPVGHENPGPIVVWDTTTGEAVTRIAGHPTWVLSLAFSPDGRFLASGGADQTLRVWEQETGKQRYQVTDDQGGVFTVAYTPDGKTLVSAGWENTVRVREADTGRIRRVLGGSTAPVLGAIVSPDGREAITAGVDRIVRRWDLTSGQETGRYLGHTHPVTGLGADGGWRMLYAAGWDGDVHAWAADQPQECHRLHRTNGEVAPTYHLAFSPDSGTLAATWPNEVVLYDVLARRESQALSVQGDSDLTAAFSPDGRQFVAAGLAGKLHRWDTTAWTPLDSIPAHPVKIWGLSFSPDGRTLATAAGFWNRPGEVKLWDPVTGRLIATHDPGSNTVRSIAFTPDGATVLYGVGSGIGRLDAATLKPLPLLRGTFHVAISPDGSTAALGQPSNRVFDQNEVSLWDMRGDRPRARLHGHTTEIYHMAFSPDGKTLATASWDGTVRLWHTATGEELLTFRRQVGVVWSVAFAPDGSHLAIGAGTFGIRELTLWDARVLGPADIGQSVRLQRDGFARRAAGNLDGAIAKFREAIRLDPAAAVARDQLASALSTQAWTLATDPDPQRHDPVRAVELATEAVQLAPKAADSWNTLGVTQYRVGKWKEAVAALQKYRELRTNDAEWTNPFFLAMAHWQLGNKHEAVQWYSRAVDWMERKQAKSDSMLRARAEAEGLIGPVLPQELATIRREGRDRELAALSEQVRAKPNDPSPLTRRATLYVRTGQFEQAMADFDGLVRLAPEDHWHWYHGGCVLAYLGREAEYREHCRAMLERFGDSQDKYVLDRTTKTALLLPGQGGGDVQGLAERARKAQAMDPNERWFDLLVGIAEYRAGPPDAAVPWLEKCRASDEAARTAAAEAFLAMAHHRLGHEERANASLALCVQLIERNLPKAGIDDLAEGTGGIENWLIAHTARREAESVVLGRPSRRPTTMPLTP